MSTYTGKYSDDRASDKSFKRDERFNKPPRAAEGENAGEQGKLKGWNTTSAGFGGPAKPLGVTSEVDKD
jgi:hypothetical protein